MGRRGPKPLGDRAMTPAERQKRRREKLAAEIGPGPARPLWQPGSDVQRVAARILAALSLGKARQVHAALGKLIRQTEQIRRKAAEDGER
jgi:hypothetical protein